MNDSGVHDSLTSAETDHVRWPPAPGGRRWPTEFMVQARVKRIWHLIVPSMRFLNRHRINIDRMLEGESEREQCIGAGKVENFGNAFGPIELRRLILGSTSFGGGIFRFLNKMVFPSFVKHSLRADATRSALRGMLGCTYTPICG